MSYTDGDALSGGVNALAAFVVLAGLVAIVVLLAMMPAGTAPNAESAMGYAVGSASLVVLLAWVTAVAIILRKRGAWMLGSLLLFAAVGIATAYSRVEIVAPTPLPTPRPEPQIVMPDMQNAVVVQPIDRDAACRAVPRPSFCR